MPIARPEQRCTPARIVQRNGEFQLGNELLKVHVDGSRGQSKVRRLAEPRTTSAGRGTIYFIPKCPKSVNSAAGTLTGGINYLTPKWPKIVRYHHAIGAVNNGESKRSSNPPKAGSTFPESLAPTLRLIADSIRSPTCPKTAIRTAKITASIAV